MKQFTLFWLIGKKEVISGNDIAHAMNSAGYGAGALRALDFHSEGDCNDYEWIGGKWEATEAYKAKRGF
tara:strand:- start:16 stop:222 length:207 start_codon:yes stop_codon:yes gene_type:complete